MPPIPESAHGKPIVMALLCWAGETEAGERAIARFRELATPLADLVQPMPHPEIYQFTEGGPGPDHEAARSLFLDAVELPVTGTIVEHLRASNAPLAVAQLRVLGGAMARVPVEATAFAHRTSRHMAHVAAVYQRPEDAAEHRAWVDRFAAALQDGDARAYVNFLGDEGQARVHDAYPGPTWDRLVEVKRRYDPTNLFHLNQNIPPSRR